MPVGACWCVVGQVKSREAIDGSFLSTVGAQPISQPSAPDPGSLPMMEGSLCLIDGQVRRKARHCSKLMCWKHAGEPSEQIAVEAGYPSSMIVIQDQFAGHPS